MGGYREKVESNKKGLDELDDSTRHLTIERLMAGIQCKKTKPEEILELIAHFRNRHSMEDAELYRLGDFSKDYKHTRTDPVCTRTELTNDILYGRKDFNGFTLSEHAGLCKGGTPLIGASIVVS